MNNNKIWILWLQGFDDAPIIVKNCLRSWKFHNNNSWEIVELTAENVYDYVNIEQYVDAYQGKSITNTAVSELIRIEILRQYGGLWVDATTFCSKPVDNWIHDYTQDGFFAFSQECDRLLCTWLLYAKPKNFIIQEWHKAMFDYVNANSQIGTQKDHVSIDEWNQGIYHNHYFWMHYSFGDIYNKSNAVKNHWDQCKKIDGHPLHIVQWEGIVNPPSTKLKSVIDQAIYPVFKLTYKYDHVESKNSILNYLNATLQ